MGDSDEVTLDIDQIGYGMSPYSIPGGDGSVTIQKDGKR